jgi:hypothetical protein
MRLKTVICETMLGLSLFCSCCTAQDQTTAETHRKLEISLGATTLAIGMPKDHAIAALATTYRVEPAGSEDWWAVSSKPPYSVTTPYSAIGNLGFESGKLVYISKRLFEAGRELSAPSFSRAFQAIVAQFVAQEGGSGLLSGTHQPAVSCLVRTETQDYSTNESKRVVMQCGMKLLVMDWNRSSETEDVMIEEIVGFLPRTLKLKK